MSKSAMERFGAENEVEVCAIPWLIKPRLSGRHEWEVIKVVTKENVGKPL